jgi:hypothetical protein
MRRGPETPSPMALSSIARPLWAMQVAARPESDPRYLAQKAAHNPHPLPFRDGTDGDALLPLGVRDPEFIECLGNGRVAIGSRDRPESPGALAPDHINNPFCVCSLDHLQHFRQVRAQRAALIALARAIGRDLAKPIRQLGIRPKPFHQLRNGISADAVALGARDA